MLFKREFYFVRHGQTDHNVLEGLNKGDHSGDLPLNSTGRAQAACIEPIIALLPIQTICVSPMKRAQETKDIISTRLKVPHHEIKELGECSAKIWHEMVQLGMYSSLPTQGDVRRFMEQVRKGLNHALSLPEPSLIVAHGGIHWAVCCLLSIKTHEWLLENCGVVHFSISSDGEWIAQKLTSLR